MRKVRLRERKLGREDAWGVSWFEHKLVEIDPRQNSKSRMNTIIHEALHQSDDKMSERKIRHAARIITELLYGDGYRRIMK